MKKNPFHYLTFACLLTGGISLFGLFYGAPSMGIGWITFGYCTQALGLIINFGLAIFLVKPEVGYSKLSMQLAFVIPSLFLLLFIIISAH
ncbi:MAG: hypothetical protein AAGG75_27865 [Bacteroidota bacterium]